MANIKKGAVANLVFPMVDATDFASIESGITASDFNSAATKKFFGVNHATGSAFVSGTISKATTLVRSGIFQQELKTAETNYDYMLFQFLHPSCADQLLVFQTVTYDDSDMYSYLSDVGSNLLSYLTGMSGMISDVDSQVLLNASMISDIQSALDSQFVWTSNFLSDMNSDLYSAIGAISATVGASSISDIASAVWANALGSRVISDISDIKSALEAGVTVGASSISDIVSATEVMIETAIIPLGASNISDVASRVWADTIGTRVDSRILVAQSRLSDVESQVDLLVTSDYMSAIHSDLASAIGGVTATLDSDAMSDIAVAVWADTVGVRVDSRILVAQSMISDVESQVDLLVTSDYMSAVHSDLASAIGAVTATLSSDAMSDIAVEVWGHATGARVDSRILVAQSMLSDVDSQLTVNYNLISDVDSQVLLNASMISDIDSALASQTVWISDVLSDMHSDLGSKIGNVSVVLTSDAISNIASAVTAAGVNLTGADMSSIASQVWINATGAGVDNNVSALVSSVSDLDSQVNLNASLLANITGQASVILSNLSDVDSQLTVNYDLISDVDSQLTLNATAITNNYNLISDVDSQLLLNASMISDIDSQMTLDTATLSALASLASDIDSQITLNTATLSTLASSVSDIDSQLTVNYNLISDVDSQLLLNASMISDIDSQMTLDTATLSGLVSQVSDVESAIDAMWTTQLTEAYSADGVAPTAAQALFVIMQTLTEFSIAGTTLTVTKLDGIADAMTFTLDDATNPTSLTRTT